MLRKTLYAGLLPLITFGVLTACASTDGGQTAATRAEPQTNVLEYVDPLIGTGGHGHTFPGALVPFGMVQLSPDNPSKGWDWTSGYHYSDDTLLGFSHTHLSGTGVGDMLDILVMPFRGDYQRREKDDKGRIFTSYSHADEVAEAGYYALTLPEEQVKAELTATIRTGVHRYTFTGQQDAQLLFDLGYAQNYDKALMTFIRVEDKHTISGYRISGGWAKYQPVYFVARFDQPFSHQLYQQGKPVEGVHLQTQHGQVVLNFGKPQDETVVEAKVALSYVSIDGARNNLQAEVAKLDFEGAKAQAQQAWQQQLAKFQVHDQDNQAKIKFYTALYHSFIAPQVFHDVNGGYFGADGSAHSDPGYGRYSLFSLWDTFRALHPLLTITNPDRVDDMIHSMLGFYDEVGLLPSWELMGNETDVMIGYHAVPVIVDAYLKGLTTVDPERLFTAVKTSAMQNRFGIDHYREYGYIPSELEVEAVSKTLEYAFDDWAIAQLAKALGKADEDAYFLRRSQSYRTLFDTSSGFMRGKDKQGEWVTPFNPVYVEHRNTDYTEANAWQYTFFVPHEVEGLIDLFGTEQNFIAKLDELFTTSSEMDGDVSPDISGLIGQYAHGNEPVHHVAYLYAFTDQKWKGEARIREIRDTMYLAQPDGLAGNDDVGQMSAWYVFSALGFYPLNPVGGEYVLSTPQFDQAQIQLDNGNTLRVRKENDRGDNYVDKVYLNGRPLESRSISHSQLLKGGELLFRFAD